MIRPFNETDLNTLHRMIWRTIDISYSGVYPLLAVRFFKDYHSAKRILERNNVGEILILEENGVMLATGALIGNEITGVFVNPDNQRQGHGKAIITELEKIARAKGLPEIILSISLPSRIFYENLGYEVLADVRWTWARAII